MKLRVVLLVFCILMIPGMSKILLSAQEGGATIIHSCVKQNGKIRIISSGETCRRNETPLDWNMQGPPGPPGPPGQLNGVKDFTSDGTFTVPTGITRLLIEAWGAAGGGGGGAIGAPGPDPAGGGGGGGGYVHGIVDVTPDVTYDVFIGTAGQGGAAMVPGTAGGDTSFETGGIQLLVAGGGGGGGAGTLSDDGAGGAGGGGNPNGGILISGLNGGDGVSGPSTGVGGAGGESVIGARILPASQGGRGGDGGGQSGTNGTPGYIIIQW